MFPRTLIGLLAAAGAALVALCARADGGVAAPAEHAHHHLDAAQSVVARATGYYQIPAVDLVREDGTQVALSDELNDGRPVVLAFIYTSCTTVCPLTSHTLSELQAKLGTSRDRVHLMSISIDPEQDTPARLREYAKTYGAGPEWHHYTGTLAASQAAQRAFGVYRGNKMDHVPAVLVRAAPSVPWVRIDGFASADQLLAELPDLHAAR